MDQKERKEFEQLFQECYEYSRKHLVPIIGSKPDFEEVFMEAISRYWVRTKQGKVKHQTNVKAFVCVTAKRLWIEQQRKSKMTVLADNNSEHLYVNQGVDIHEAESFNQLIKEELEKEASANQQQKMKVFNQAFAQLGENCQKLLKGRFIYKIRGKELAAQLNLKNANVVKTTIARCKQALLKYYQKELQKI